VSVHLGWPELLKLAPGWTEGTGGYATTRVRIREGIGVVLSDQLDQLAAKATQVQDQVAAAKQKTKAELEAAVPDADLAHRHADDLAQV
jgi:hypothetical protein